MQYGPQDLAPLSKTEKRFVLMRQFPEWFDINGQFARDGYLTWAIQQMPAVSKAWLYHLKPKEIASVTNVYHIWNTLFRMKQTGTPSGAVRDWLKTILPFWLENGKFDAICFTAWYQHADFKDQEIVFGYLNLEEQKDILKIWALNKSMTFHTAYNKGNLDWSDEAPEAKAASSKTPSFLLKF